jgi:hypothetical protein
MTIFQRLFSICSLLALAACGGGGGDAGAPGFGGGTGGGGTAGTTASDLVLVLSSASIPNSGSEVVTATVTALDGNRNALANVPVTITADNDAVVTVTTNGTVTTATGTYTASVGIGSNRTNRTIVVTAKSGNLTKTANLTVITASQPVPTASDISLTLNAPSIPNSGTVTVTATVTAVDINRNAIAGIPITLKVDNGASIIVSGQTTSNAGIVTGAISIGANPANRPIVVTATSGTLTRETVLQVVGTRITATSLPAVLTPGAAGTIQYRVTDASNSAMASLPINITGPGGVATNAVTDLNGAFEYRYTAPVTAGDLSIRAAAGGISNTTTIIVQAGAGVIPPAPAGSVRSASVRANPSVVVVNTPGSTQNRAEVRALFVGTGNAPIQNIRVRFDLNGDINSIGGTMSSGSNLVYSDVNGVALSAYIPASRFSPTDGVSIRACWDYQDFPEGTCPNSTPVATTTTLTVISDPLSVTIGTDNIVYVDQPLVYYQRFVIQVNDSSGLAKPDTPVTPLLDLLTYSRGIWIRPRDSDRWIPQFSAFNCENEDVNRNGVLEVYSNNVNGSGVEDANGDGELEPRKADVVVSYEGSTTRTNAAGLLNMRITYPRNYAGWVTFNLTVAATGVAGTEGRASFVGRLLVPFVDLQLEGPPPFQLSPYGDLPGEPRIVVTTPDGRSSATLCR